MSQEERDGAPSKCKTGTILIQKAIITVVNKKPVDPGLLSRVRDRVMMEDTTSPDSQIACCLMCAICASPCVAEMQVAEYQLHANEPGE